MKQRVTKYFDQKYLGREYSTSSGNYNNSYIVHKISFNYHKLKITNRVSRMHDDLQLDHCDRPRVSRFGLGSCS